jgi:hypothetical protein
MARATAQAIRALVRRTERDTAPATRSRAWKKTAVRTALLILTAVCFSYISPFIRISYAQEKNVILSDSGIIYPGGYDLNTVGDIQGKIKGILIPGSGPVRITLTVDKETYTVLASPGWFWKSSDAPITEGMEISVHGSKTVGIDGNLYIIAQKITVPGTNKTLALRSESGKALWSGGYQKGQTGSQGGGYGSSSGGFGSSSGGRTGGSSSGRGRGR